MLVLREVAQYVHPHGIKFRFYLDDWLIHHLDPAILSNHLQFVLDLATHLGWLENLKKSDLVPSQQFTYLGLDFDMQLALVQPSLKCVERLEACIHLFLWRACQPAHAVLQLLGHMVSVADLTRLGRLDTCQLQFCLLSQWWPHHDSLEA